MREAALVTLVRQSGARPSFAAGLAKASAFLYRRVNPYFARDDGVRWRMGGRSAGHDTLLSGVAYRRGCRQARRCDTHMLASRDIVRYTKSPSTEESHQAAASLRCRAGGGRQRTLSLKFVARRNPASLFVSAHYHCPNAYIASPCTTVV
jgi:hypothetical protein